VDLLEEGADVAVEERWMTAEQRQRYLRVLVGEEVPRPRLLLIRRGPFALSRCC
jgi:hypothetical protein